MVFKVYIFLLFLCFSFLKSSKAEQLLYLEDNFFPEGITISENGDIYIGSLKENKIVKFSNGKKDFEEFIPSESNNLLSVIGILADDRNKALWACSSNPGVTNYPSENPVTSLKVFDLITGNPLGSYELPNGGFCNDIAKDSKDNIYITDSFNPRILRLNKSKGRLETWFENDSFKGEGFNLNGITFMDNHIYTVKMNSGELFKIKVKENGVPSNFSKITLPRPLNAPDGIKTIDKNNLLVVENKGSLSIIKLSDPTEITVIRDNLDTPTTVAIKKDTAWVLEAQFGHLFGEEKNVPPGKFKIVGVKLKTSLLTRLKSLLNISN